MSEFEEAEGYYGEPYEDDYDDGDENLFDEEDEYEYEDPRLGELSSRVEQLAEYLGGGTTEEQAVNQFIDGQLDEIEHEIGKAIPDDTANLIGRLAFEYRDEDGIPNIPAALEHIGQAESDQFEAAFDDRVPQLEKQLGREITDQEVQELWESATTRGDTDAVAAWRDLHPDGKDPLKDPKAHAAAVVEESNARQREEGEEAEPETWAGDDGRQVAERLDGEEVAFRATDDGERRAAMAQIIDSDNQGGEAA